MGTNSKIEWTDHTWNPWRGCTRVSPACDFCYMMREASRYGFDATWVERAADATFQTPLAKKWGDWKWHNGSRVFVCSWSDFFHQDADAWREEAWDIMRRRPGLVFQLLTKRPDRVIRCLPDDWGEGWPNVWLGVTAENQEQADKRLPTLLAMPAAKRFVSVEPMLGSISLKHWLYCSFEEGCDHCDKDCNGNDGFGCGLDWVICGGESGPNARPMHPQWAQSLRDQCTAASVPFFFKQWGEWWPIHGTGVINPYEDISSDPDRKSKYPFTWLDMDGIGSPSGCGDQGEALMLRTGRRNSGCLLDGRQWKESPV